MAQAIYGMGTAVCAARSCKWGIGFQRADCDALECVIIAYLPLLPYKAVHAFNWSNPATGGSEETGRFVFYEEVPIRWSLDLLVRVFAYRWLAGVMAAGL